MKHIHLFETQEEMSSNLDKIVSPWVVLVKESNALGMHTDKSATEMFNTQIKQVTITENGTTTITPDNGYGSMDKVSVTVDVASSGNNGKWLHINGQYEEWNYNYLTRGYINALFNLDTHEVIDNSFAFTPEDGENGNPEIYEKITAVGFEDGKLCFYNLTDSKLNPCIFSIDSNDELEIKVVGKNPDCIHYNMDITADYIRNIKNSGFNTYYFEAPITTDHTIVALDNITFTINGIEVCVKYPTYPFYIDGVEYKTDSKIEDWQEWVYSEYNTDHYVCWSSDDWGDSGHPHNEGAIVNSDHTKYLVYSQWDSTTVYAYDRIQKSNNYVMVDMSND